MDLDQIRGVMIEEYDPRLNPGLSGSGLDPWHDD